MSVAGVQALEARHIRSLETQLTIRRIFENDYAMPPAEAADQFHEPFAPRGG